MNNTGAGAISGTFTGLAEGATVTTSYGGNTFTFQISYVGGDGNDITLTRIGAPGQVTSSNTYLWTPLAGSLVGSLDLFSNPEGVAVDASGNVYVADRNNHVIRKVTPAGVLTTLAGIVGQSGSSDGTGSVARFNNPKGVAVDGSGNIYVADQGNHTIRKVTPSGEVATLAGSAGSSGSADGVGSAARLNNPRGVAVDVAGNIYVGDVGNHTIRKVTSAGVVTTLAGSAGLSGSTDGTGSAARFYYPASVAVDGSGNLYVADTYNHTIRKVSSAGVVTTLAGTAGSYGSSDGTGSTARFIYPLGVAVDDSGNVYVADQYNHAIRKVTSSGVVNTLAGSALNSGSSDGTGSAARFNYPAGVVVDGFGNVYVADSSNGTIRKVTPAGVVTTLAGTAGNYGSGDGASRIARFNYPKGVAVDSSGNVYVADQWNHTIRKVTPAGVVSTLAGSAGLTGSIDGTGDAARFFYPMGVAVDDAGNVYVADFPNHTIRKVTQAGVVTTLAGSAGSSGSTDGTGSAARFSSPSSVTVDGSGNLYVADFSNHTIRKVTSAGVVTTLAGTAGNSGSSDGTGSAARFSYPSSVAVDGSGNLYVAEFSNHTIRKVTPAGVVTTLAGSAGSSGSNDGTGSAARFYSPTAVAVDGTGNIYVADSGNHTIRRVTSSGVVTTVGGLAGTIGHQTGYGSAARFYSPQGVAVSASGRLYASDNNHRIVHGETSGFQPILALGTVSGLGLSGVTLNGTVNPNGFVTTASFEYGLTPAYGSSASVILSPTNGSTAQNVSAVLSGLNPGTLYYYRLTASNVDGTTSTSGGSFTTFSADLSDLTLSSGSLSPAFASATTNYTASVVNSVTSITVTPTVAQANATLAVRVNSGAYATVTSGSASSALALNLGSNTVDVRMSAQDGVTQKIYTVTVTRLAATLNPTFNGTSDVPVSSAGFVATGTSLGTLSLGFVPTPQQELLLVNNTGTGAISGTFTGLAEGATVTASYGGNTFTFRISYVGGNGNDITLTRVGAPGQLTSSNTYLWSPLAGSLVGSLDLFSNPEGVAVDASGNVYVADQNNHVIRKVTPAGVITTLAGSVGQSGSSDGTGSAARFNNPRGIAVDAAGNLYVGDQKNHTIRKVTSAGVVTTLAGSAGSSGSADGTGNAARLNNPRGVAVDSAGNVYVADLLNHTIRKMTPSREVTTLAGTAGSIGSSDGTGSAARFNNPFGVAVDASGNVYVADAYNHTIRKVTLSGVVNTLAGTAGLSGNIDSTGSAARFTYPTGVSVDEPGNVYVADYSNHTIRKVTSGGMVTTLAGTAGVGGSSDGTGSAARFNLPAGVTVDGSGNVYVADSANDTIRKVIPTGAVSTLAGIAGNYGSSDGASSVAKFNFPRGLAIDSSGNVYVADQSSHTIRKVTPAGVVSTLAGSAGLSGSSDGTGSAARFNSPRAVAVDNSGNVYVADQNNHTIRKVTTAGVVTTLAGSAGSSGSADGTGSAARFNLPKGVAVDGSGNVYVADYNNETIRKITSSGVVTTLAGSAGNYGGSDGTGSAARFNWPTAVAVDGSGNVYVADYNNHTVRKVTSAGVVTTLAGTAGSSGSSDGIGSAARFYYPAGLAVDASGSVYVSDRDNHTIRKVTSSGVVSTVGGLAGTIGHQTGYGSAARFYSPQGVAVSASGRLYASDNNHRIVHGETSGFQPILALGTVSGLGLSGVTLNGTVNPNGFVTTASFEYGLTPAYGSSASVILSPTNGSTAQNVSAVLSGLNPGTLYYYRLTASNVDGTTSTSGGSFTTFSADLSDLTLSSGSLSPAFASATTNYTASVVNSVTSITVTPTVAQANATLAVRVNSGAYATVTSGSASSALALNLGSNTVDVRVTAQDGVTQKIYTVIFTRLEPLVNPSFSVSSDVPVTSAGFVATGNSLGTISLGFAPGPQQVLRVVNNTGTSAVSGIFTGLAEGATVTTSYGGNTYSFRISYVGGDGNDVTLTRVGCTGQIASGGSYLWSLLVGSSGGPGSLDATGASASFMDPRGTAVDSVGNIYIADTSNHAVRKVTSAGVVTTLAGSAGISGSSDGTGNGARFNKPRGVAVDSFGNVYVADQFNHTIRKVTSAGVVTTLAGSAGSSGSSDGTGSAARFNYPGGVAVDSAGNVFVADSDNRTIRKVTSAGVVTTLAGSAGLSGSSDGTGSAARFNYPTGVTVNASGEVYVADSSSHTIRKLTSAGVVTTLAGTAGNYGSSDGTGSTARFYYPAGVAVDGSGNLYVTDEYNHTVRKVTSTGVVTTLAGSAGISGSIDGTGSLARFNYPKGVAVDIAGNVYLGDSSNYTIRKVAPTGVVTTLAGSTNESGSVNGAGSAARFNYPMGLAVDSVGNIYVADRDNHTIRKTTAAGVVTTLAGSAGVAGSIDGTGGAARFWGPRGVTVDSSGNAYVADSVNHTIRKVTPAGVVTTLAGTAFSSGSVDGTGSTARFNTPNGVAVDSSGNVYVADSSNHTIRKVTPGGLVTTLAGSAGVSGSLDGTGTFARFNYPCGVAVDGTGNLYVADLSNHTIRKVTSGGLVTTLAGSAGIIGSADGTGGSARFYNPWGVSLDAAGNLYVGDQNNHTIRKVTQAGVVSTIGGLAAVIGREPGYGSSARFYYPQGIAVSAGGRLYVSDDNHRVAQGQFFSGFQTILTQGGVSEIGLSGATLNGTVNPNGFVTTASFEYGPTQAYGSSSSVTLSPSNGTTVQNVSAVLTGLSSGTLYYYRLTATNADGTASTSGGTFSTISTNANLSGLTMSNGTLSPVFASGTTSYTASVANATTSITVTPTSTQNATFEVRANAGTYAIVTSGSPSSALALNVGSNTIDLRVTAQDGVTQKIYTITVTRLAATLNPSFNGSSEVPVTSAGFVATGTSLGTLSLGFVPGPQQVLLLVSNTGTGAISGTFMGLAEGATVTASYGGNTFTFRISYAGGDGNDIVLTRTGAAGQVTSGGLYLWSSMAGSLGGSGALDGTGAQASFFNPQGTAVDSAGNVYVADSSNHTIRKVTSAGVVTTLAGSGGLSGSSDGTGSAARFSNPTSVAVDSAGNVYVADRNNHTIRKVTSAGVVTTLAGSAGWIGAGDGTGSAARFYNPSGVAVDSSGNVYVADQSYNTIRKVTPAGVVTTLAGSPGNSGSSDGTGSAARFNSPTGLAVDGTGNVYVADQWNHTIRKVTPAGVVTTLAGSAGLGGSIDGTPSFARFNNPWSVAVDSSGNVYVADSANHTIRRVTPTGTVTTLGGLASVAGRDLGYGSAARFSSPRGIAVSSSGRLYVADDHHRLVQGQFIDGFQPILTQGVVSGLGVSGVTLNGTVNPNGFVTTASFEYGPTLAYGNSASVTLGTSNGTTAQNVSAALIGLRSGTLYYYRLTGTNLDGTASTSGGTFTTFSADLSDLNLSRGTLNPSFDRAVTSYTASVANATTSITVTPTLAQANTAVSIRVNAGTYAAVTSGSPSSALALNAGSNTIDLRVTAQDGVTQKIYTITVTRLAATLNPSFNGSSEVPVTSAGFVATGTSLGTLSLGFVPGPQQVLLLVSNTGTGAISGTFMGLAEGATVTASYGGNTFTFRISYAGGDGNDIVLTRIGAPGQVTSSGTYLWNHLAGSFGGQGALDAQGAKASFSSPQGTAVDSAGNVYVADSSNHTIRKVTSAGVVITLAGSAGLSGNADGAGSAARFSTPTGVAVDSAGNVYVADRNNHTIRKVTSAGVVTTLAGSVMGSSDGIASAAMFYYPMGVAVDGSGNVYVAEQYNYTIRKVTPAGVVTTLAGSAGLAGSSDGMGSAARFNSPAGVAVDSSGNVYVADRSSHTIRKITPAGLVTTFAGRVGLTGTIDGTGSGAMFNGPTGVTVDGAGNLYVVDQNNHTVRKVTSAGVVTTLAGRAGLSGSTDGTGIGARFNTPAGVTVDGVGNVYLADKNNHIIRKVTSAGVVTTLAGRVNEFGSSDATGSAARFQDPQSVAVDSAGNTYVADTSNHTIRKVTSAGVVTTLAGNPGNAGYAEGTGSTARFNSPTGVAVDSSGNVYVADQINDRIRKVTPAGVVTTLAGSNTGGWGGSSDGAGSSAQFYRPTAVTVDGSGNVYVADRNNNTIRKVTSAGVVTTLAGSAGSIGATDGTGSAARFYNPSGVAVDSSGNVYVADQSYNTIRKVTPAGVVTTLAGSPGNSGSSDGTGSAAQFNRPRGVAVDSSGNVYVADQNNHVIRKVTATGTVTTLGGMASVAGRDPGYGSAARFSSPQGIAVSTSGRLYVTDGNHRVAQGEVAGFQPILTQGVVSGLGFSAATLSGSVNPNGFVTTASFEYGPTLAYGSSANLNLSPSNGTTAQNVTTALSGLSSGTLYFYRLTATNADGTASTSGGSFTTFSADLSSLTLSSGTLSPGFARGVASYTAMVGNATTSIIVTPTSIQNGTVSVRVNSGTYAAVASGSPSSALALNVGSNTIDLRVTAQDGVTQKIYTITVTRLAATLNPSFNGSSEVPVTSAGFVATGTSLGTLSLGFVPGPQQVLLLVSNTGTGAISGTFMGLAEGATVTASYGGNTFTFRLSYAGGDGNDIVLTRTGAAGQLASGGTYRWSPLAGSAGNSGSGDGAGSAARFSFPFGIAVDGSGNVYVADYSNHTIRKVTPAGVVTTLAGSAGISGSSDGTGSAARFNNPQGVALDGVGNVYVADRSNHTIRKVTATGVVTTLAGSAGLSGSSDGTGSAARFYSPRGLTADGAGNVYVADSSNHTIRKVTAAGVVTTLAGTAGSAGTSNGIGAAARFNNPIGISVGSSGILYVTDFVNHTVRKVLSNGEVSTFAGAAGLSGILDGTGDTARFNNPCGIAVGASGDVFVTDSSSHTIRKVASSGVVSTVGGVAGYPVSGVASGFVNPYGISVSLAGRLYVSGNQWVVQGEMETFQPILTQGTVSGLGVNGATLNGTVNPNGFVTTASFEYGLTPTYGSTASLSLSPTNGTSVQNVSTTLTGLSPGTLYYYRLTATNADGTVSTSGGTFTTFSTNLANLSLSSGTLSPIFASATTTYMASVVNTVTSITVTPTIAQASATLAVRVNSGAYATVTSGTPSSALALNEGSNTVDVRVTAQDGVTQKIYTVEVIRMAWPAVTAPTATGITSTEATLGGDVSSDGWDTIIERGVVYARTVTNGNPVIDADGVTRVTAAGTTGVFTVTAAGLDPDMSYSFKAYATNSQGITYSSVGTFTTLSNDANLNDLSLSRGTLSPVFASATTRYTVSVGHASESISVAPISAQAHATVEVRVNANTYSAVTSGGLSENLPLNVGRNTIDVRVTAQDGVTQKIYTVEVIRMALPAVTAPTATGIASTEATLGGDVNSDGWDTIIERGVVYARTETNGNPVIDGNGVTRVTAAGMTGVFNVKVIGLDPGTLYSFKAYAANSQGITYGSVGTFTTLSNDANLSDLSISSGTLSPVFASTTTSYAANISNSTTSITITPVAANTRATLMVRLNAGTYASVNSGSSSESLKLNIGSNIIDIRVTAQDGVTQKVYTVEIVRMSPPTVTDPTATGITATDAVLGGNVISDGSDAVIERGVVYSVTETHTDPLIEGAGVNKVTTTGTTGVFTVPVTGLEAGTGYTFKAFATNRQGTTYSSVGTFTTLSTNADLADLALSEGTLSPVFSRATTSYTASVANGTTSITVTPTRAQSDASMAVRINGGTYSLLSSGSPSGDLTLSAGSNTIDVRVTAQDGVTQKVYTVEVTVSSGLTSWRRQYFGSEENSGNGADLATPDGDGISNLVKYALLMTPGQNGSSRLPQAAMKGTIESRRLSLSFQRDPSRNDVSIIVEAQSALGGIWTEIARSTNGANFTGAALVSETSVTNGVKNVVVEDMVPNASRRFMRLRIER